MKKQLDPRIAYLITNAVQTNHRAFIVLVGDKGRDQVVNLHFLLSQARVSARPSVLWCYKKDLGFTTHRKKREAKIKRDVKRGIREANDQNPFEIFVTVTDIRYTYYKESHKILGNTFGMCVLQDFEAITPNVLARTIETVQGGGLVVLLLKTMTSLKQLYTMAMDVHARYRTSSHETLIARFNERFILSLSSCDDCLILDDELNVLPLSRGKDIGPLEDAPSSDPAATELKEFQDSLADTKPIGDLVKLAKTIDQAKALVTFVDAIADKTLSSTVTLTSARGRGKSAALGLAMAAALAHGYSNIFVTSPTPENLNTLFDFLFKGMDALGFEEHLDYDIAQSTNPDFNKAIVRVNVFRQHRQTIQYIQPEDAQFLGQAELVIIDEAAAIPLPVVRNLIGPYLVFLSSTIHGYEGTGRSLSLKLIEQLRESARTSSLPSTAEKEADAHATTPLTRKPTAVLTTLRSRVLREVKLETPIRYSAGDQVEKWLNSVLCLDATLLSRANLQGCPHPSKCELYYVSRDTLFSYHPASELFLQRMMSLYVASHYKNQPNDLQLMSDAPAHHLFVLLPPLDVDESHLPEPLVVVQVALEGDISKDVIMASLNRGVRAAGDMIPWLISQQFQENNFGMLSGARIVRIATHPDLIGMGYGKRALEALDAFYSGEYFSVGETVTSNTMPIHSDEHFKVSKDANILTEELGIRSPSSMPPLLQRLSERSPEKLDYLGVSFGLTPQLLRFWKRSGYTPLYLRQTSNEVTGEHTCVMLRGLSSAKSSDLDWLAEFARDFRRRFLSLLSYRFREFGSVTALSLLEGIDRGIKSSDDQDSSISHAELNIHLTPFDLKRLDAYVNNQLDYHVVLDTLPAIAKLYFENRLGETAKIGGVASAILLAVGLQRKTVEDMESELKLPVSQVLALFVKALRKMNTRFTEIQRDAVAAELPLPSLQGRMATIAESTPRDFATSVQELEEELHESGHQETELLRQKQREMIDALDLSKFAVDPSNSDWSAAEARIATGRGDSNVVSIKSAINGAKRKAAHEEGRKEPQSVKRKKKKHAVESHDR